MDCLSRIFLANGSSLVTCYLLAFFVLKCVCLVVFFVAVVTGFTIWH